jgi:hypothetical protein
VHADPPVEHKAYLHRSGRTARAGNAGTVVTIMTDEQVKTVADLVRKAGIKPTTTRVSPGHELLSTLAPGDPVPAGATAVGRTTATAAPATRAAAVAPSAAPRPRPPAGRRARPGAVGGAGGRSGRAGAARSGGRGRVR